MPERKLRRMVLDLTPVVDVVMILLFAVMINSVALTEVGVKKARVDTEQARTEADEQSAQAEAKARADRERLLEVGQRADELLDRNRRLEEELRTAKQALAGAEGERESLAGRLEQQKRNLARAMAKVFQMSEAEAAALRGPLDRLTDAETKRLSQIAEELRAQRDPARVYKAVRRIEEMQKVFTFIDLHLDKNDFLTVVADGERLDRRPVRDRSPDEIENLVRRALEAVNFNQMVLVLFSYEGEARDLTVERTESSITSLLTHYRAGSGGQRRQFRYGRVGLVEAAPQATEGK